jgi:hypothetical protein
MCLKISPSEFVSNHFNIDLLTHTKPQSSDEVFIDPRLKLAHPISLLVGTAGNTSLAKSLLTKA